MIAADAVRRAIAEQIAIERHFLRARGGTHAGETSAAISALLSVARRLGFSRALVRREASTLFRDRQAMRRLTRGDG